jgi:hypothetical protein
MGIQRMFLPFFAKLALLNMVVVSNFAKEHGPVKAS